jgi:hypothetical protein
MARPQFRPTFSQTVGLAAIAIAALTFGFYMRYAVIEQSFIGVACQTDPDTWQCQARHITISLFRPEAFGWTALGAALLNLVRPSIALWGIALLSGGTGIVLHNTALSALAAALLLLSLARPAPEAS